MALRVVRHLDLAVLVLALPVFLAAGWPIAGWGAGTGIYLVQWGVRELTTRRAARSKDPREVVGLLAASMIGRGFAAAIGILLVGIAAPKEPQNTEYKPQNEFKLDPWIAIKLGGLDLSINKAVLFLAAFTVAFMVGMALRPLDRSTP